MTNKEKFLALVSKENNDTIERNRERIKNRAMLRESQNIALKVVLKLEELGWKQTDLAREMNVSPQQITKIVSGKENLTIETQVKLQTILNIPILASYYENALEQFVDLIKNDFIYTTQKPLETEYSSDIKYTTGQSTMEIIYNKFTEKEVA